MNLNSSTSSRILLTDPADDVVSHISSIAASTSTVSTSLMSLQSCVVALAIIGAVANGSVCFLLVQLERKKSGSTNLLIINQQCIDLFSCIFAIIGYSTRHRTVYLTGIGDTSFACLF